MIYQVNMEKFSVEHQAESWLCWAATVKAVANYKGLGCPDQQGLGTIYKNKATGNSPSAVLEQRYKLKASNLIEWATKPSAADIDICKQDLRDNLKLNLSAASGPLLCGLTEANDTAWNITVNGVPKPKYTFKHATLIFKFDDISDTVYLADPARPDAKGRYVGVSVDSLVRGFEYIQVSDLGPKASAIVPVGLTDIKVRLYRVDKY